MYNTVVVCEVVVGSLPIYLIAAGLLPTLGSLLTNPVYIFEVMGSVTGVYYIAGWVGFLPKYFEEQFFFTASEASIYSGLL